MCFEREDVTNNQRKEHRRNGALSFGTGFGLYFLLPILSYQYFFFPEHVTTSGMTAARTSHLSQRQQPSFDPVLLPIYENPFTGSPADTSTLTRWIYTPPGTTPARWAYRADGLSFFRSVVANPAGTSESYNISSINSLTSRTTNSGLAKTSTLSWQADCRSLVINGGPFHSDASSSGPLVTEEELIDVGDSNATGIGIGVAYDALQTNSNDTASSSSLTSSTKKRRYYWILGNYDEILRSEWFQNHHLVIESFVTGFQWLMYNGSVVADNQHDDPHGVHRAPRTAVGVQPQTENDPGNETNRYSAVALVVDGCEKCWRNRGPTLTETAKLLNQPLPGHSKTIATQSKVQYAINMDGGGSSTLVWNHQVRNQPTCYDMWPSPFCERPVRSAICLDGLRST